MTTPTGDVRPRILALDLSLTHTGVCYDGATRSIVPGKLRGPERLVRIEDELLWNIANADLAYIEGYAYGAHHSRAVTGLAELGGLIRVALYRAGCPLTVVAPASLKWWATGKGNAAKLEMLDAAHLYGWTGTDHNEADAFLLWMYAREKEAEQCSTSGS